MAEPRRSSDASRPVFVDAPVDRRIAALAAEQHGVVALRQLTARGLSQRAVSHRAAAGRLHRVHRGVYAVGHPALGMYGRWMAAVLACGAGATLSHASAAMLWEVVPLAIAPIDVSVPTPGGRKRPGLRIHRQADLPAAERERRRGIPVTSPARTLLDVAGTFAPRPLERALDEAHVRRLADVAALDHVLRAHPNHRGARKLADALERHRPGATPTQSVLEERFLMLCRAHRLPQPRVDQRVAGLRVDFLFEDHGVVVETDGWAYHRTRNAFERDRERDATLARAGYRTLRFTDHQVRERPAIVVATLVAALGIRRSDAA